MKSGMRIAIGGFVLCAVGLMLQSITGSEQVFLWFFYGGFGVMVVGICVGIFGVRRSNGS